MNPIKQWIETGCDFMEGRKLYNAYGPRYRPNEARAAQINNYENFISRELLREELEAMVELLEPAPQGLAKISHAYTRNNPDAPLPNDLALLKEGIPNLYKQRDRIRYAMREIMSGPALFAKAREAVILDQEIRKRYKILDYFIHTGMYPPAYTGGTTEGEQSLIQKLTFWLRAQRSYPSQISRLKKDESRAEEVAEMRKVMADINEYLDNDAT